jgi:hypothetical protein
MPLPKRSISAPVDQERVLAFMQQATLTVYEQGVTPTWKRVTTQLADPGMKRTPEGRATWHAVRKEIGLEP